MTESKSSPQGEPRRGRTHRRVILPGRGIPIDPEVPPAEVAERWEDHPEDEDAWLRAQVPPHWQNP